ncbi:hypothetical protein QTN25_008111 [Entamoeba marina]
MLLKTYDRIFAIFSIILPILPLLIISCGIVGLVYANDFSDFLTNGEWIFRIIIYVLGALLSSFTLFFVGIYFNRTKSHLIWYASVFLVISVMSLIFIPITTTITTLAPLNIWDVDMEDRNEKEIENNCCYYTDIELYHNVNGNSIPIKSYNIFADCAIVENSTNIKWDECFYENDQLLCSNINLNVFWICKAPSNTLVLIIFEALMLVHKRVTNDYGIEQKHQKLNDDGINVVELNTTIAEIIDK